MTGTGDWRIRELDDTDDVLVAAEDVRVWGFPREVDVSEILQAAWFRMGKTVVWWYEHPDHTHRAGDAWIHLAVAPRVRGRWPVRRWATMAEGLAELMGFTRLVFTPRQPCGYDVAAYALRLGWRELDGSLVRDLGG